MFGMKKMPLLIVALVLLFAIWFFFLRGRREGMDTATDWSKATADTCGKSDPYKNGNWDSANKKCNQAAAAVETAAKANDSAMDAIAAAQKALGGLGMPK